MRALILILVSLWLPISGAVLGQKLPPPWGAPVWSDEFEAPQINRRNWTYDTGAGGWGNQELEYYTDRPENSYITNGCLVIEARKESFHGSNYTSARLKTLGLHSWKYGRVEARINLPAGQGVWPAFWMLGENLPEVGWPACGELDIMEHVSSLGPNTIRGSVHGPNDTDAHGDATTTNLSGQFHVFALEWEPTEIRYYLDDQQYFSATPKTIHGPWVFDRPFFILLNLAIGGSWPGPPDATTPFPARMLVDYVRVYQDQRQPVSVPLEKPPRNSK
jgi:beta-glucanase (GH16 family)